MPRNSQRCAYAGCNKTTDVRRFGRVRVLTDREQQQFAPWLSHPHFGVVCDAHHRALLRHVHRTVKSAGQRLDELAAAASAAASLDHSLSRSESVPLSSTVQPSGSPLRRSSSSPLLRSNKSGCSERQRRRIVFTCIMSGTTWTQWNRLEANLNGHSMNKSTWYRLAALVWDAVELVKADREAAYVQQLLTTGGSITVMADGAWSHPGYTARQHDWVLMNAADNKVIFTIPLQRTRRSKGVVVHQGNYDDGSSRGMEGFALDMAIAKLQVTGLASLVSGWVGDQAAARLSYSTA